MDAKHRDLKQAVLAYSVILRDFRVDLDKKLDAEESTHSQMGTRLGIQRDVIPLILKGEYAPGARGRVLSTLMKYIGYPKDKQDRILQAAAKLSRDAYNALALRPKECIVLFFDLTESFSKNMDRMNMVTFAKAFAPHDELVAKALNLNIAAISDLSSPVILQFLEARLIDDNLNNDLTNIRIKDEENRREKAKEIMQIIQSLPGRPLLNEVMKKIDASEKCVYVISSMAQGNPVSTHISHDLLDSVLERVKVLAKDQPITGLIKPVPTAPATEPKVKTEDHPRENTPASTASAEVLKQNVKTLLERGMYKHDLAEKLGIPRKSIEHLLRSSVGQDRVNKLLPITEQLLQQLAVPALPAPTPIAHVQLPKLAPAVKPAEPSTNSQTAEIDVNAMISDLLAGLHVSIRTLKTLKPLFRRKLDAHERLSIARAVHDLYSEFLSDGDIQSLLAGTPMSAEEFFNNIQPVLRAPKGSR